MRTYQAGTPGDERALCHASVVEALAAASKSGSSAAKNSERIRNKQPRLHGPDSIAAFPRDDLVQELARLQRDLIA